MIDHARVFDRTGHRAALRVDGCDRVAWLQGLLTQDIRALTPGDGAYSAMLTAQGRMITDMIVLAHNDHILLDLPRVACATALARLESFIITEDVTVTDVTASRACLSVQGARIGQMTDLAAAVMATREYTHSAATLAGVQATLISTRELGAPGVDIVVSPADAAPVMQWLEASGVTAADDALWEPYRVLAGRPRFGVDMTPQTIPLEAGIEARAISHAKGCYVGQEIIVRMRDIGHGRVARRMVGLRGAAGTLAHGVPLMLDGREVGRITSVAAAPDGSGDVALATVVRDASADGTALGVDASGAIAMIVPLPFS